MRWQGIEPVWTSRLRAAIEAGYHIFEHYRTSEPVVACMCPVCMTPEVAQQLRTTPLRAISTELLSEYTNSAHGYDFDRIEAQFKGFIPRYFELIAACTPPHQMATEYCLRRLGDADYRTRWPRRERDAVDAFFDALVDASVQQDGFSDWPVGHRLDFDMAAILTMILIAGGDLERALDVIDTSQAPSAALHVATLRARVRHDTDGVAFLHSHFLLGEHRDAAQRLAAWAMSAEWTRRLEAAILTLHAPPHLDIIERGLFAPE